MKAANPFLRRAREDAQTAVDLVAGLPSAPTFQDAAHRIAKALQAVRLETRTRTLEEVEKALQRVREAVKEIGSGRGLNISCEEIDIFAAFMDDELTAIHVLLDPPATGWECDECGLTDKKWDVSKPPTVHIGGFCPASHDPDDGCVGTIVVRPVASLTHPKEQPDANRA